MSVTRVYLRLCHYYKLNKGFFLVFLFKPLGGLRPPRGLNKKASEKNPLSITCTCILILTSLDFTIYIELTFHVVRSLASQQVNLFGIMTCDPSIYTRSIYNFNNLLYQTRRKNPFNKSLLQHPSTLKVVNPLMRLVLGRLTTSERRQ